MRVGILSDTHDKLERTQRAVELLHSSGAEVLIHCGDFTTPEIVTACAVLPLYFVFGNNDVGSTAELQQAATSHRAICLGWGDVIELDGKRLGVVHGHRLKDYTRVLNANLDYLLLGHSHEMQDSREGSLRSINPGALHRASIFSVALLDLATDALEFHEVSR